MRLVARIARPFEALHALEQVADLEVGVAVVRVPDLGALAEQRVGLVEEQDHVARLGSVEHAPQVLLGLADVLVDDLREVDAVQRQAELVGEHLGRHRLAGAGRAGEQHRQPGVVPDAPVPHSWWTSASEAIAGAISSSCSDCLRGSTSSSRRKRGRTASASSPRSSSSSSRHAVTSRSGVTAPFAGTRRATDRIAAASKRNRRRRRATLSRAELVPPQRDAGLVRQRRHAARQAPSRPGGTSAGPPRPSTASSSRSAERSAGQAQRAGGEHRRGGVELQEQVDAAQPARARQRLEQARACRASRFRRRTRRRRDLPSCTRPPPPRRGRRRAARRRHDLEAGGLVRRDPLAVRSRQGAERRRRVRRGEQQRPDHQRGGEERAAPVDGRVALRPLEQAVALEPMARLGGRQQLARLVPQPLGERQRRVHGRRVVDAGSDDRSRRAVETRQHREREQEALARPEIQLASHPRERPARRPAGLLRLRRLDLRPEVAGGLVVREETLLVLPVAGKVERLDDRVGRRRQRATPTASGLAALVPHPEHLAAQPQRHLAQPVPCELVLGYELR